MISKIKILFICVLTGLLLFGSGCEKFFTVEPETELRPVAQKDDMIILKAKILSDGFPASKAFGFLLVPGEEANWEEAVRYDCPPEKNEDSISLVIPNTFERFQYVSVAAFAENQKGLFRSNIIKFRAAERYPEIEEFAPKEVWEGDLVIVYGKNFGSNKNEFVVSAGEYEFDIIEISDKRMILKTPAYEAYAKKPFKIQKENRTLFSNDSIKLCGPVIFSHEVELVGEHLIIRIFGENFSNIPWRNESILTNYYESYEPEILSADCETLIYRINSNFLYPGFYSMNIWVDGLFTKTAQTIAVPTKWQILEEIPMGGTFSAVNFAIGDYIYVCTGTNNPMVRDATHSRVMRYDIVNNTWKGMRGFPGDPREAATGFSIGAKAYLLCGLSPVWGAPYFSDFWEYNPATDLWVRLADYPGKAGYFISSLVYEDKAYVGLGFRNNEFWVFDPADNSWEQLPNLPELEQNGSHLVYMLARDGIIYVFWADGNSQMKYFKYDISLMEWTYITNPDINPTAFFAYGDANYIMISDYNNVTKQSDRFLCYFDLENGRIVEKINMFPGIQRGGHGEIDLLVDEVFFYGGGVLSNNSLTDLWKFELEE